MLESGRNKPSEQTIRLICREFNINYLWLTTGEDPMYVPQERISLAKMERIMEGHNPYVKAIFMELADMRRNGGSRRSPCSSVYLNKKNDRLSDGRFFSFVSSFCNLALNVPVNVLQRVCIAFQHHE